MDVGCEMKEYVQVLCKRILSFLPNRTGHSVEKIELNPQFLQTRRLLVAAQEQNPEIIVEIIAVFSQQLEQMYDPTTKLRNRDDRSVTTTLMVCKLLAEILKRNWHRENTHFTTNLNLELVQNYSWFQHYDAPRPIHPARAVASFLETFAKLVSSSAVRQMSSFVKGDRRKDTSSLAGVGSMGFSPVPSRDSVSYSSAIGTAAGVGAFPDLSHSKNPSVSSSPQRVVSPSVLFADDVPVDRYLDEIDEHTMIILRYLAAANPEEYYSFMKKHVYSKASERGISEDVLKQYCSMFHFMFSAGDTMSIIPNQNNRLMRCIKSSRWRMTFFTFIVLSVRDQILSRPMDFLDIHNAASEDEFRETFEQVHALMEHSDGSISKQSGMLVLTWVSIFCVQDFESFLSPKPKLRPNKRIRFLAQMVRDTQARVSMESFSALINIFHVGCRLPKTHPVAKFTQKYLNSVFDSLLSWPLEHCPDDRYENAMVSIYLAALMVEPQTYIKMLIQKFIDYKDNVKEVKVLVKIIKGVSVSNRPVFLQLMKTLAVPLKSMIFGSDMIFAYGSEQVAGSKLLKTSLDSYSDVSSVSVTDRLVSDTEIMLADLFDIFTALPESYFNVPSVEMAGVTDDVVSALVGYGNDVTLPLKQAFKKSRKLFEAACSLALTSVSLEKDRAGELGEVSDFLVTNLVVQSICEASMGLSVNDPRFKASFVFINKFMAKRQGLVKRIAHNSVAKLPQIDRVIHTGIGESLEQVILVSMCTHDIQFYNIARTTMEWYITEVHGCDYPLLPTFQRILSENMVFTGFVSLHKKVRSILREAYPTESFYQVWFTIYQRWLVMLENTAILNDDNLVFRHFTGFLVSTAGCFICSKFDKRVLGYISDFFDKCIGLLSSKDLVIRVVIKESLSTEAHSNSYHLIGTKFMALSRHYVATGVQSEDSISFAEQVIIILSSMINVKNSGSILMISMLPEFLPVLMKSVEMIENPVDLTRLKLRFCKFGCAVELEKRRFGILASIRSRNMWAKKSAEWLDDALFNNDDTDQELVYLKADLATQCSSMLALQLESSLLEVPDGITEVEHRKYKDLAFGNYFSLFYKIIQKYTKDTQGKNKYKFHLTVDNVLKCLSTILQSDTDIGMQFVLPLGYHSNLKIRGLFLDVFASMLTQRQIQSQQEEFTDDVVARMTAPTQVYGAVARVASSTEHNLLASALYGMFGYSNKLDKLFRELLRDEIVTNCQRQVDIFRRNSTITKLLSTFAKDAGHGYLESIIPPFLDELVKQNVVFEVEKNSEDPSRDAALFMEYLSHLVDRIVSTEVPASIRFVCHQISEAVKEKFHDASLVAVGSFLFLRFLCPAIISPESVLQVSPPDVSIKRSLMQLVKVLQNVANDSLGLLKWASLAPHFDQLAALKDKVYLFLDKVSQPIDGYPFAAVETKPIAELRYIHKFIFVYFSKIRHRFFLSDPYEEVPDIEERIKEWYIIDEVIYQLRLPKPTVKLQIASAYRAFDNTASNAYNDFMAKMSLRYVEKALDSVIIRNSIFGDGTSVVVVSFRYMPKTMPDMQFIVFKLLETAAQVWDNLFYMVYDFTEYKIHPQEVMEYCNLFMEYAPVQLIQNCKRVYYFNIPILLATEVTEATLMVRKGRSEHGTELYCYSQVDANVVNQLCLDPLTISVTRDVRVSYNHCLLYAAGKMIPVQVKLGREWLTICSETSMDYPHSKTPKFFPVDVYRLAEITRCEVSSVTGHEDEFTIWFEDNQSLVVRSAERAEILRFLYFSTSRLAKNHDYILRDHELGESRMPWFGRLYNIVFQGLLSPAAEVRSAASNLFASLSSYYSIDFGLKTTHSQDVAFPSDITSFVVTVSRHLAGAQPNLTFRFLKAYFDSHEKIAKENQLVSIMYLQPWIKNIHRHVFMGYSELGPERVAEIVRQFCRMTLVHRENAAFINDYIWRELFAQESLLPVVIDEVVSFAIDNSSMGHWDVITAVITPSVEVCSEVINKLLRCVVETKRNDSLIASRSKLYEIRVLVNICASLFFNSYLMTRLFLADVLFLVTLFIDNQLLDFGANLQKLVINVIQSFFHKPDLTDEEEAVVDESIDYFSDQRAKMLFGVSRDKSITPASSDATQVYNRALSFEMLCDYLDNFLRNLGSNEDRLVWRSRWISNAIEVALQPESLFQNRALIVVGILSKRGTTDSVAQRFLKVIATDDIGGLELTTNAAIATSCMIQGLPESSKLPSMVMWPQLCFGLLGFSALYQASTNIIVESMIKMMRQDDYIEKAFEIRKYLEPLYSGFERDQGYQITRENFHYYVLLVMTQGMHVSNYKSTSLEQLKRFLEVSHSRHRTINNGKDLDYLAFIVLSSSDSDFTEFLTHLGLELDMVDIGYPMPKVVIDFFLDNSDDSKIVLLIASQMYSSESVDPFYKSRFLQLYQYIFRHQRPLACMVYPVVRSAIRYSFVNATATATVDILAEIQEGMLSPAMDIEKAKQEVDALLSRNKLELLGRSNGEDTNQDISRSPKFQETVGVNIKRLQMMAYRASCLLLDGEQLED